MVRSYGSLRGHGAYTYAKPGPWGRYGRAIGSSVGGVFGGGIAGPVGRALGSVAGGKLGSYAHYIGKIFGSGDYVTSPNQVKYNVLVNESQIPQFSSNSSKNTVRIRHREFLGDIISSGTAGAFQIQSYSLNPGLASFVPWLSQVCGSTFQQYRNNGVVFEFRSMSGDALTSANTALGSVVIATDYDSADNAFTSKSQMENTEFGVSCKPSSCMIHAIECARSQTTATELYVRAGNNPANTDIRLYDWGKTYVATVGFQGTSVNCGELWVSYDITLFKAIQQPPGYLIPSFHMNLAGTNAATPLLPDTSVNATQPVFDTIGIVSKSNTSIVLPLNIPVNSNWMVLLAVRGASTASVVAPIISSSNGLVTGWGVGGNKGFINNGSSEFDAPHTAATSTTCIYTYIFTYNGNGTPAALPTLSFGVAGTYPGTPQGGDLVITMVNGNIA